MHYQALVGAGEKGLVIAEERSLRHLLSTPGVREWWSENPYAFGPEFRSYVEEFLAEAHEDSERPSAAAQQSASADSA
jgi:hypothetical protein